MRRISRLLLWSLGVCLIVNTVACTSSRDSSQGEARPQARQESCTVSVGARQEPPADYRLMGEDVAIPDRTVLPVEESGEADPAARLFAKWGLIVRAGAVVDLRVAPGWEDRARLAWGTYTEPAVSAHVRACAPADDQPQWLAFVGGTYVARAACVPLTIRSRGQTTLVRLGIGVPCDGTGTPRS